jgi:hypothetical protein
VNPYLPTFFQPAPVAGVIRPDPGTYRVVFDSPTKAGAGRFTFRFWIDDRAPPRVRLLTTSIRSGGTLLVAASDPGAGVDPRAVFAGIDGAHLHAVGYRGGRVRIPIGSLRGGRHRVVLQVSDRQEAKNMENVPRVLPNTTVVAASFTVR